MQFADGPETTDTSSQANVTERSGTLAQLLVRRLKARLLSQQFKYGFH